LGNAVEIFENIDFILLLVFNNANQFSVADLYKYVKIRKTVK